ELHREHQLLRVRRWNGKSDVDRVLGSLTLLFLRVWRRSDCSTFNTNDGHLVEAEVSHGDAGVAATTVVPVFTLVEHRCNGAIWLQRIFSSSFDLEGHEATDGVA